MAEGLPSFLWACPACFAVESLAVVPRDRSVLACGACGARWRVDPSQRLHALAAPADDMRLITAHDRILAHFGERPVADAARHARDGVVLEEAARISRIAGDEGAPELLGEGLGRLYFDRVGVYDAETGAAVWETPLSEVKAVMAQLGNHLHLRVGADSFQLEPVSTSRPKWIHFTEQHWQHCRRRAEERRPRRG